MWNWIYLDVDRTYHNYLGNLVFRVGVFDKYVGQTKFGDKLIADFYVGIPTFTYPVVYAHTWLVHYESVKQPCD